MGREGEGERGGIESEGRERVGLGERERVGRERERERGSVTHPKSGKRFFL